MDSIKKGNKEVQERILIMQKEKDKVRDMASYLITNLCNLWNLYVNFNEKEYWQFNLPYLFL